MQVAQERGLRDGACVLRWKNWVACTLRIRGQLRHNDNTEKRTKQEQKETDQILFTFD